MMVKEIAKYLCKQWAKGMRICSICSESCNGKGCFEFEEFNFDITKISNEDLISELNRRGYSLCVNGCK